MIILARPMPPSSASIGSFSSPDPGHPARPILPPALQREPRPRWAGLAGLGGLALLIGAAPAAWLVAALLALAVLAVLAWPLLGLALAAFGVPFGAPIARPAGAGALGPTPLALALAAMGWLLAALGRRRLPQLPVAVRPATIGLALFVAAQAAAAWRAPDLLAAGFEMARWWELGLAMVLTAALAGGRRPAQGLLAALLLAGLFEALRAIGMALGGVGPEAFGLAGGRSRAFGSFGQPNPFAGYMNMVWPIGAALVLARLAPIAGRGIGGRHASLPAALVLLGLASAGATGMGLVLSWSRGGWLAAAAAALAMGLAWLAGALLRRRPSRAALALVWLGLLLGLGLLALGADRRLPPGIAARLGSIGTTLVIWDVADAEVTDANFATVERVAHWQAAAAMWAERPWLGQGPGHYEPAYPRFRLPRWADPLGHAHNIYLHILAETGLAGLVAYLAFFATLLALAARAAFRPGSSLQGALGLGLLGVLTALAVHSFFDHLYVHELTVQLGLLAGLTAAAATAA